MISAPKFNIKVIMLQKSYKNSLLLLFLIVMCFLMYRIGVYSNRVSLKDIPKYFQHFSEYQAFRKLSSSKYNSQEFGNIPRYINEYNSFEKLGGKITNAYPILNDYNAPAGTMKGGYFHHDLLVASFIYKTSPIKHVDVGSRFDGFVAHVASFREIEVMDLRDLDDSEHKNISFLKMDLMVKENIPENITDSISSLNAIEHFGLGRYGDTIDPDGHIKGFNNILRMLKPEGILYIAFPIGKENQVFFNAHRVFHPLDIFNWADDKNSIELVRFDYVDDDGNLHQNIDLNTEANNLNLNFGFGIYSFRKVR